MGEILYGNVFANEIKQHIHDCLQEEYDKGNRRAKLAVLVANNDPGSASYIRGIVKQSEKSNIDCMVENAEEGCTQEDLIRIIHKWNADDTIDGIMVQMPLPKGMDSQMILDEIDPNKDMDGLQRENVTNLYFQKPGYLPCTPEGVMRLLSLSGIELKGKEAVVIGRSSSVGRPLAQLMINAHATVTVCHSRTVNIQEVTKRAEILVCALGKARFVKEDMVKEDAIVIDIGVNMDEEGVMCGDTDFDNVLKKAKCVTPVVKGVGSMTTAILLEHVMRSYMRRFHGV
ncbi:MAG: bifunctional 5,10-methylenetetrahydrofolate dehydrogenase/5,10-methenyltetrahydrofolate cyclohydrolase [Erysipelotrichaceae bacterium]|nr:bifunctional 5,10-methylenetetrahydrofolate dehydrogenase/5,10-methenyltetrahydrofolate cyclohydrolase [Erysipelotrichaceae bacterium]